MSNFYDKLMDFYRSFFLSHHEKNADAHLLCYKFGPRYKNGCTKFGKIGLEVQKWRCKILKNLFGVTKMHKHKNSAAGENFSSYAV